MKKIIRCSNLLNITEFKMQEQMKNKKQYITWKQEIQILAIIHSLDQASAV